MITIELFSGTESFSKVARERKHKTFTIDKNSFFFPDVCVDFLILNINSFVSRKYNILWASPPCTSFSVASIGKHWDKKTKLPKSKNALLGLKLLDKTIEFISKAKPDVWFIENPRGMMRKVIDEIFKKYNINDYRRVTITYCQYGTIE